MTSDSDTGVIERIDTSGGRRKNRVLIIDEEAPLTDLLTLSLTFEGWEVQTQDRAYSEYWTLIRSAATRGASHNQGTCPSCAAPLTISMAGVCTHCGSHLTRGEFDWVLSKIEQDDVYEG